MKLFLPVLFLFTFAAAPAQEEIKSITLSDTILYTAIDRPGDFYAVTKSGQIQRFDPDGKLNRLYKGEKPPTLFDPRDGARLFAYYRHDQHYEFLNPSFKTIASYRIDSAFAIQPWLICPSGEYKLWVLDQADRRLKKIDVQASQVVVEIVVDTTLVEGVKDFTFMREYQNFVFLLNPGKGILIFNSIGKHIRTIEVERIKRFHFLGEELYFLKEGKLQFFNLFTAEMREVKTEKGFMDALLTDERIALFKPLSIYIFPFRP
jgi:hypothetical protein